MANTIKTLQYGKTDWSITNQIYEAVEYYFEPDLEECEVKLFDVVLVDRNLGEEDIQCLFEVTKAYTLFVTDDVEIDEKLQWLMESKKATVLKSEEISRFLSDTIRYFFSSPYGEKLRPETMAVAQGFRGNIKWNGYRSIELDGDFGSDFTQILYPRRNIEIFANQSLEFWLEFSHDEGVEIEFAISKFSERDFHTIQTKWVCSEEELKKTVYVDNDDVRGFLFAGIRAKGKGKLIFTALHFRYSRHEYGSFLPGGKMTRTAKREELFSYFDPMDMRPPLNVYFSGYKTQEGFEGYFMMRRLGAPFLLIGEPRIEGGCGYMGDEEYERNVAQIIDKYRLELGFDKSEVVLSGLSMGTVGALYYAPDVKPGAVVIGKPLVNWGNIARNGKIYRPSEFATSFDILNYLTGDDDDTAIDKLNQRFWNKFSKANLGKTTFAIAYMIEDDYDGTAYGDLISHLQDEGVVVYGKGMHGRHNDNSAGINNWFVGQYKRILKSKYGRNQE